MKRVLARDQLEERIKLLSALEVLEPLGVEELAWVAQRILDRSFHKGEFVYAPGNASEVLFLLLGGSLRLYGMTGGQELTFEILQAGTMFGVASMMERAQDEYALALAPSRIGMLNLSDFWHVVRQNPQVIERVVRLLGERLRLSRGRMMDIALKEVPARLASLLFDLIQSEGVVTSGGHYKILGRYTHEQLATMIGAKRASVTRAFGKLQDIGCVQLLRRQVYVTDLALLSRLAVEA